MPLTGTLRTWHDDRGFGFIAPTHGGREVFVHISAFPRDGSRPTQGEQLSYELGRGKNGEVQATKVTRSAIGQRPPVPTRQPERRSSTRKLPLLMALVLVIAAAAIVYTKVLKPRSPAVMPLVSAPAMGETPAPPASTFRCDGRRHCSQMTSCAEAKYFLKNCPDTAMDGNHDGTPCEQQWCTSPWAP
jgi:cold shock CspA family protein